MKLSLSNTQARVAAALSRVKSSLILCFISTFVFGLLAHAYGFLNSSFSHDVLNAFIATATEEHWKVELGRFVVPFYRAIFRGGITMPWLLGLIGLSFTALAAWMTAEIFEVHRKLTRVLICGIMVTNISWIAQIATYIYEFDINALSLLLAVASVYVWKYGKKPFSFLWGSLLLMLSIGIYQAFISVAVTLAVMVSIMELLRRRELSQVLKNGFKAIGMLLLGGLLYFVANKLVTSLSGIVSSSRTHLFFSAAENGSAILSFELFFTAMRTFVSRLIHPIYPRVFLLGWFLLLCLAAFAAVAFSFKKQGGGIARVLLILVLLLCLPIAIQSIYFLVCGTDFHDLMAYATWFVYIFILVIFDWIWGSDIFPADLRKLCYAFCGAMLIIVCWWNVVAANGAYIKKEMEAANALSTMTRVVSALEQREDYIYDETLVAFVGTAAGDEIPAEYEPLRRITGLETRSAISYDESMYYFNVYRAYFRYVLNYPMNFCDDAKRLELKYSEEVAAMPCFPDPGYMKFIDDILVIKMGK